MKKSLVSLLAIIAMAATSALTLTNNFSQSKVAAQSDYQIFDNEVLAMVSDYSEMKKNYESLEWHAEHAWLATFPFYGAGFIGRFTVYYNGVVEPMLKIAKKLNENPHVEQWSKLLIVSLTLPFAALAPPILAQIMRDNFYKDIKPAYLNIISLFEASVTSVIKI